MSSYIKRKIIRVVLLVASLAGLTGTPGWGSTNVDQVSVGRKLAQDELMLLQVPMHMSEFAPLASPLATPSCAKNRPPEALATPDPLLELDDSRVRVSFIVNSEGRVVSPFILESAGATDDGIVLRAVRYWRFRPALCNGVPTEMEARVRFVGRPTSARAVEQNPAGQAPTH